MRSSKIAWWRLLTRHQPFWFVCNRPPQHCHFQNAIFRGLLVDYCQTYPRSKFDLGRSIILAPSGLTYRYQRTSFQCLWRCKFLVHPFYPLSTVQSKCLHFSKSWLPHHAFGHSPNCHSTNQRQRKAICQFHVSYSLSKRPCRCQLVPQGSCSDYCRCKFHLVHLSAKNVKYKGSFDSNYFTYTCNKITVVSIAIRVSGNSLAIEVSWWCCLFSIAIKQIVLEIGVQSRNLGDHIWINL